MTPPHKEEEEKIPDPVNPIDSLKNVCSKESTPRFAFGQLDKTINLKKDWPVHVSF